MIFVGSMFYIVVETSCEVQLTYDPSHTYKIACMSTSS